MIVSTIRFIADWHFAVASAFDTLASWVEDNNFHEEMNDAV